MSDDNVQGSRPIAETRAELARLRARHTVVEPEWSWSDVDVLLAVAAGLEPSLAGWLEEVAIRVGRELEREERARDSR